MGTSEKAYPFSLINEIGAVNDMIEEQPVVVFWGAPDTADALDAGVIANAAASGPMLPTTRWSPDSDSPSQHSPTAS